MELSGAAKLFETIRQNTSVVRPAVLPELYLRLVTYDQPWWHADPSELEAVGIVDPYWAFCWPGGTALARYLLDRPQLVRGQRVLDFGSGCGVGALSACLGGASKVIACDIDPLALWAASENASLNRVKLETESRNLIGTTSLDVDLLLVGDVTYSTELVAALLPWFNALAANGTRILVADPGRGFLPPSFESVANVALPPDISDVPVAATMNVPIYELGSRS